MKELYIITSIIYGDVTNNSPDYGMAKPKVEDVKLDKGEAYDRFEELMIQYAKEFNLNNDFEGTEAEFKAYVLDMFTISDDFVMIEKVDDGEVNGIKLHIEKVIIKENDK